MDFPKQVMSLSELKKMGFPPGLLYQAAGARNSGSFKSGTGGKTSPWYFKTKEFGKWLDRMASDQKEPFIIG